MCVGLYCAAKVGAVANQWVYPEALFLVLTKYANQMQELTERSVSGRSFWMHPLFPPLCAESKGMIRLEIERSRLDWNLINQKKENRSQV